MEDIRRCKKRGTRGIRELSWTSARHQDGRAEGGVGDAGGFCPWRPLEVIKPWQARTFAAAQLAPSTSLKSLRELSRISARHQDGRAGGGGRSGGFWPVEAAGGYKTAASAYFRGRAACAQYDPKVILGAKTLDPKGHAYCGS